MRIGDYVRTKDGYISKIKELGINIYTDVGCWSEDYIIKSRQNIIDLIEAGDYVNGRIVEWIGDNFVAFGKLDYAYEKDIKSIVTKEQFESIKYIVKE